MNGTIFINPGAEGVVTLDNVNATDIQILSGATNSIHLNNVKATNLLVNSATNVRVVFDGQTVINNTTVVTRATLELEAGANITNVSSVAINASVTIIAPTTVTVPAVIKKDVVVKIKDSADATEEKELVGTGEEIDDLGAVAEALKAVNTASNADAMMTAIETNAATLGLPTGDGTDYASFTDGRDRSVSVDLFNNRSNVVGGYTLTQLREIFNDIVATRLVTQESMNKANEATTATELEGYVTILLTRFQEINNPIYTQHSSHKITDKIAYLQGLVNRYEALTKAQQTAVLEKVIELRNKDKANGGYGGKFERSQYTTDAFAKALDEVETKIVDALKAVNNYLNNSYNYNDAPDQLAPHLTTLGFDLTKYNELDPAGRKMAVFSDLYNNKPDGDYNLETLQTYFSEIVETRHITQESLNMVNSATEVDNLKDLKFVTMLRDRFQKDLSYNKHSAVELTNKVEVLNNIITTYNELPDTATEGKSKENVIQDLITGKPYDSSSQTIRKIGTLLGVTTDKY